MSEKTLNLILRDILNGIHGQYIFMRLMKKMIEFVLHGIVILKDGFIGTNGANGD